MRGSFEVRRRISEQRESTHHVYLESMTRLKIDFERALNGTWSVKGYWVICPHYLFDKCVHPRAYVDFFDTSDFSGSGALNEDERKSQTRLL